MKKLQTLFFRKALASLSSDEASPNRVRRGLFWKEQFESMRRLNQAIVIGKR